MVRSVPADELLRRAREAAGMGNVREAIRDITLHALRSHLLTAGHIATVARTVGEGIRSSEVEAVSLAGSETRHGAWEGLEDAVGQALLAVELAARQFVAGRGSLEPAEREQALAEFAAMAGDLGEGWRPTREIPALLRARIESVSGVLARTQFSDGAALADCGAGSHANEALSQAASGALRELSGAPDDVSPRDD